MLYYVIRIEKQKHITLKEIEKYLKTTFESYDYMVGFCDGYLFDSYKIFTVKQIESMLNDGLLLQNTYHLKWIQVKEVEEE